MSWEKSYTEWLKTADAPRTIINGASAYRAGWEADRWISVEDDKPKKTGYYQAWHMAWDCPGSAYWNGYEWRNFDIGFDIGEEVIVSHWQPLPEPPEDA